MQHVDLRCAVLHSVLLLEEWLKANAMSAWEVHVVKDWTVIECMASFATCSTGSTGVELFAGSCRICAAVSQPFEVIKSSGCGDVTWVVSAK